MRISDRSSDGCSSDLKRKTKWLFTMRDHPWFCIAGIWRQGPAGEAFTMLTMDAGEDVAPYHHRQIIPLTRDQWADWLDPSVPAQDVLRYLPKGSRSEERRVGKECVSTCRSRGSPYH